MADSDARRRKLREQFFVAHADGMRAVAAHDSAALFGAIIRENEAIVAQTLLVGELRDVFAMAYGAAAAAARKPRMKR